MSRPIVPVTVVVVAYNHADHLVECLESIAAQTVAPRRVVVYDDCSPDDSAAVARSFIEERGLDFEVKRNPTNQGLCRTLNDALGSITTEFYAYISADDIMLPDRLERQYAQLADAADDVALSYTDAIRLDRHSQQLPELFSEAYAWPSASDREGAVFVRMLRANWIPAPSVMLRLSAVLEVGGYDPELFFEDNDLWLRLARRFTFVCIPDPLVGFRELSSSLGHQEFHSDNPRFLDAHVQMLTKHLDDPAHAMLVGPHVWNYAYRLWRANGGSSSNARTMWATAKFAPHPVSARINAGLAMIGAQSPRNLIRSASRIRSKENRK